MRRSIERTPKDKSSWAIQAERESIRREERKVLWGRGKSPRKGTKAGEVYGSLEQQAGFGMRSRGGGHKVGERRGGICGAQPPFLVSKL